MPNHPHATMARRMAGTFAPTVPKLLRASTGNGMPYLVPGCEFSRMGASTIVLPRKIVKRACAHDMPAPMSPEASVYVGMQCAIEIQSAAKL